MSDTEEKQRVDRVAAAIAGELDEKRFYSCPAFQSAARCAIEASGLLPLLSAATTFIEEAESMGWGETSEKAFPGSFDALLKAVREAKG